MKLQTKIPINIERYNPIDYDSKLLLLGSCFVENIGAKFNYYKFQNILNPFGILFHPKAIETLILNAVNEKKYGKDDIFFLNERWHCFEAHSELSANSEENILQTLNDNIDLTNKQLNDSTHIIITLGTAWVYRFIENDTIVSNCHKAPQKQFLKELLSINDIVESLESMITLIRSVNPKATLLFTVSPVRHVKDGFVENTQSKSHLISALHRVVDPRRQIHYFPSYEIMMDELRDYRFYKEDMLHPNTTAIDYIWSKFQKAWISKESHDIMNEVDVIQKGMSHKPFNPSSEAHQQFLKTLQNKKEKLKTNFPHIVF